MPFALPETYRVFHRLSKALPGAGQSVLTRLRNRLAHAKTGGKAPTRHRSRSCSGSAHSKNFCPILLTTSLVCCSVRYAYLLTMVKVLCPKASASSAKVAPDMAR